MAPRLPAEPALLRAFIALLDEQERALVSGDAARIEALAGEIAQCVDRLSGIATGPAGAALTALRRDARLRNARNGALIALRSQHVRQRLEALGAMPPPAPIYGADGRFRTAY